MPALLIIIGLALAVTAYRGSSERLFELLKEEFDGEDSFVYWVLALGIMGAVGYYSRLRPISDGFLLLILLVMFIRNKGFFDQFVSAFGGSGITDGIGVTPSGFTGLDKFGAVGNFGPLGFGPGIGGDEDEDALYIDFGISGGDSGGGIGGIASIATSVAGFL